jgi:hypothetical protein
MLCITYTTMTSTLPVTLIATSILAATSDTGLEITIVITNLYKAQLSLFVGLNTGFLSLLSDL